MKFKYSTETQHHIYWAIFTFSLVVFGFFGIYRNFTTINEKRVLLETLDEQEKIIDESLALSKKIYEQLAEYRENVDFLNMQVPTQNQTELYLEQMVAAVGSEGYIIESLSSTKGEMENSFQVTFSSLDISNLEKLFEQIENLERLTNVQEFVAAKDQEKFFVKTRLTNYSLEGKDREVKTQ